MIPSWIMNDFWIKKKAEQYFRWIQDNTEVHSDKQSGWFSISTPFVDAKNDAIELFVKNNDGIVTISDDGETLSYLQECGADVSRSESRKRIFDSIRLNFGVETDGTELFIKGSEERFPSLKHALLQAIQQISDLRMTSKREVLSMFSDEVRAYMDELGVIYTPDFIIRGSTSLDFVFDFQIAGRHDEMVIKSFNRLHQQNAESLLFSLGDIMKQRQEASGKPLKILAIVNDVESDKSKRLVGILREQGVAVGLWGERSQSWKESLFMVN